MSGLDVYMRESERMVARLGFWSSEFRMFRDWWQTNQGASSQEVQRRADTIWREANR